MRTRLQRGTVAFVRIVAAALAVLALAGCGGSRAVERPDLRQQIDQFVTGPDPSAPGITAFVAGPRGEWSGAAGYANVATHERMQPDARLRLESVSKLWTAAVVVKLAAEHRLRLGDTVERHAPGLLPFGDRITIRQLLNHTSGLLDNNDIAANAEQWLARVHDPRLRAQLIAVGRRLTADPAYVYDDALEIRMAGAVGLLSRPGQNYHYSNIGYKVLGRIAERVSGTSLGELYRRVIIEPLDLQSAAYDPSGPIEGAHPIGYIVHPQRRFVPASDDGAGALGAEGGIVSDAKDEATFLRGLVQGKIVPRTYLRQMFEGSEANTAYGLGTGIDATCAGEPAYTHNGGGASWASSVAVSGDGSRVAVILLNGRPTTHDPDYAAAVFSLLCDA